MGTDIALKWVKPKTVLRKIIASSSLTEARKDVWNAFIDAATENEIIPILDAVANDADAFSFFTENLIAKIEAVSKKDASLWRQILEKEKAYLGGITN